MTALPRNTFDLTPAEARDRFEWALRRGQPCWLWPEVAIEAWQEALHEIERATREVLTQGHSDQLLCTDPVALGIACYTSGMGALLGYWLREGRIAASPEAGAVLMLHLGHNGRRMAKMADRARTITGALRQHGVEVTVLKGMHTAWSYFPAPETRSLADIDLLVHPDDEDRAGSVLATMGLRPGVFAPMPRQRMWLPVGERTEPVSLCFVHADDPWTVDLQMSLNRRYSAGAPVMRIDDERDAEDDGRWPLDPEVRTLGQPLLTVSLACHAGLGLTSLTLLRLVELVLVIRQDRASGRLFWDDFLAVAARIGALGAVWPALGMCEALAPGTVPLHVLEPCEIHAPRQVRNVLARLTPATAHRVTRCSFAERFMWSPSVSAKLCLLAEGLLIPQSPSFGEMLRVYRRRAWRLAYGTITRE